MRLLLAVFVFTSLLANTSYAQQFDAISNLRNLTLERLISAFQVSTRQTSLSAQQETNGNRDSNMALANVVVEESQQRLMSRAISNRQTMLANEAGLCNTLDNANNANLAVQTENDIRNDLSEYETNWISNGGNRSDVIIDGLRLRRTVFCTPAEQANNLCASHENFTIRGIPAGDSSSTPWLTSREYGTNEANAGTVFIDNVAPMPTMNSSSRQVTKLLEFAQNRREAALLSITRGSLADILVRGMQGGIANE